MEFYSMFLHGRTNYKYTVLCRSIKQVIILSECKKVFEVFFITVLQIVIEYVGILLFIDI